MTEIRTEPLFTLQLQVAAPLRLGATPLGERLVVSVLGGSFEGPRLRGTVESGGSDWLLLRPDGALQLDVRIVLRSHDDHLIGLTYRGFRHGPADIIARVSRGEAVDPSSYYFRVAPVFETASEHYGWLNRIIAVGTGQRRADGPIYEMFEVL
jgi:hypothetical protein